MVDKRLKRKTNIRLHRPPTTVQSKYETTHSHRFMYFCTQFTKDNFGGIKKVSAIIIYWVPTRGIRRVVLTVGVFISKSSHHFDLNSR